MKKIRVPIIAPRPTFKQKYAALVAFNEAADDPEHWAHGVPLAELVVDEMNRVIVPNRAMRRKAGWRSGYSRRRYLVGQMSRDMARLDAIEDNPQRLAQHQAKQAARRERAARVAARVAARRERLGLS